jgi:uncharacterized protein YjiS (DUF1127 family)
MISSTVARRYSGSSLIDSVLVRGLALRAAATARVSEWQQRAAGRRELVNLTERDLRDIGISRSDAEAEANKPFWQE